MTQVLPRRTPRARPYLSLLLLIPACVAIWFGWTRYDDVPAGGTVEAVKHVKPETPDLYIQVYPKAGPKIVFPAFKDTPIGNGLTWNLPKAIQLNELDRVEVWDHNAMWKDKEFDRITLDNTWEADG